MEDSHLIKLQPPLWLPIVVALVVGGMYMGGKYIERQDFTPVMISVQGEGKITAAPDIAMLNFGVETGRQKTADVAMAHLSDKMTAIVDAVQKMDILDKDISTSSLSLNPSYDWDDGERTDRGFEARQTLVVKIRDLNAVSSVLGAATSAGANQVGGVSFTMDNPNILREEARAKAIKNAEDKAEKLAMQLGMRIKRLKGYNDGGYATPMMRMESAVMMEGGYGGSTDNSAPPIPSGEQEVNVTVSLTYELE